MLKVVNLTRNVNAMKFGVEYRRVRDDEYGELVGGPAGIFSPAGQPLPESGSIILTAALDALMGCAGLDAYTAAKGGGVALARSFATGIARERV
jgi:NAD(P)-dependent dehydrogenase (short-subunit alcohol dehydrogenase family)